MKKNTLKIDKKKYFKNESKTVQKIRHMFVGSDNNINIHTGPNLKKNVCLFFKRKGHNFFKVKHWV